MLLESILNRHWCDVLTTSSNYELLDSASDLEKSAPVVQSSLVACLEVAVLVEAFLRGLLVAEVAHHYVSSVDSDLALALLIWVRDFDVRAF